MFKQKKPRSFNFKTRYWNPEEEERNRRKQRGERQKQDYSFDSKEFKEELAYRWGINRQSNSTFNKKYNSVNRLLLLAIIAAVIIAILIYMRTA